MSTSRLPVLPRLFSLLTVSGRLLAVFALAVIFVTAGTNLPPAAANDASIPTGTISGHISLGTADVPARAGKAGVEYTYCGANGCIGQKPPSTLTDANGDFAFSGLPNGKYSLFYFDATAKDFQRLTGPVVNITDANLSITGQDAVLVPTVTLAGTVSLGSPSALAGEGAVTVQAWLRWQYGQPSNNTLPDETAKTDASGAFLLTHLTSGSYDLHFVDSGSGNHPSVWWSPVKDATHPYANTMAQSMPISTGSSGASTIQMTMPLGATITGAATTSDGHPLRGADYVNISRLNIDGSLIERTTGNTQADGTYSLGPLIPGRYTLEFVAIEGSFAPAFAGSSVANPAANEILDLKAGQHLTGQKVVQFANSSVLLNAGCAECGGGYQVYLQRLDPVGGGWITLRSDAYRLPEHRWPILTPGTYRPHAVPNSGSAGVTKTGPSFVLTEGQDFSTSFDLGTPSTGSLIKLETGPEVYVLDGDNGVIPITSFGTVADMGLATSYSIEPYEAIRSLRFDPQLTNKVNCGWVTYIAGSGKLWPIAPALVEKLPQSFLRPALCAVIPKSTISIDHALFLKSATSPVIWFVDPAGVKHAIHSVDTVARLSAPDAGFWLTVNDSFLGSLATGVDILAPGTLVKSPSSPAVYLVDGTDGLVPIPSFAAVSDLGLPPSYRVVSTATLSERTVASSALSNVITCGASTYFAGSGKLWPVASPVVATLPTSSLSEATCAAMPRSGVSINHALFVKSATSPLIWHIDTAGAKRPVLSLAAVAQLSAPDAGAWLTVNEAFIAARNTGPAVVGAGALVKSAVSPVIYLADGIGGLVPIPSFESVSDLGLPTSYSVVSAATISGMTVASSPLSAVLTCGSATYLAASGKLWPISAPLVAKLPTTVLPASTCAKFPQSGTSIGRALFVKSPTSPVIWFVDPSGAKRAVRALSTVAQLSAPDAGAWVIVNDAFIASLPRGDDVLAPGSLVKASSSPAVYLADGIGGLVPIPSFAAVSDLGLSTSYSLVSATIVSGATIAGTPLSNVIKCGSATYFAGSGKLWPVAAPLVTNLSATTLPASTCAAFPQSGTSINQALFVRSASSPVIWHVDASGTRHALSSLATVGQLSAPESGTWLTVNEGFIVSLPLGAPLPS